MAELATTPAGVAAGDDLLTATPQMAATADSVAAAVRVGKTIVGVAAALVAVATAVLAAVAVPDLEDNFPVVQAKAALLAEMHPASTVAEAEPLAVPFSAMAGSLQLKTPP